VGKKNLAPLASLSVRFQSALIRRVAENSHPVLPPEMGNPSVPGRSSAQFSWLERGTLNAAGSSPVAPAIGSCGDDTVRSKSFDIAHGRLAKETAIAVECSPTDGACAAILLTNSVLTSIADDSAVFWAGFVTYAFPLS